MIVPTLGISVPDHIASVLQTHAGADTGVGIVIVGQTYDNVQAQQFLADVCRRAGEQAGVRAVAVEGAEGAFGPARTAAPAATRSPDAADLRSEIRKLIDSGSQVSAGVLALLTHDAGGFEAWGVDDLARVRTSQGAMTRVMSNAAAREQAFTLIRPLVESAQRKVYSPSLAAIRIEMMPFGPARRPLAERVAALIGEAERTKVALSPYPAVKECGELGTWEKRANQKRVAKERAEFVKRVTAGLFGWFERKGGNKISVDPRKLEPVLEYWWEKTGMTRSDYDRMVAAHGYEKALLELKRWLESWLAVQATQTAGASSTFYEELMRLALRLGIPYFDLLEFREATARGRFLQAMRKNLADEMNALARELCAKSQAPRGPELWTLEERLDWLFRALALEVPANEAEVADLAVGRLTEIVDAIARLAGVSVTPDLRAAVKHLEPVLNAASEFLQLSWERGGVMARRTLERLEELGEDRALLVAGGFHMRAITHALLRTPSVSWSVVAPSPDLNELGGRRRLIG